MGRFPMDRDNSPFEQKFAQLKADYIAQLPKKLSAILDGWNALRNHHSTETINLLQRDVHNLIGTSGTFGFLALSQAARNLEVTLRPLIEHSNQNFTHNTELSNEINAKINQLFSTCESIHQQINTTIHK